MQVSQSVGLGDTLDGGGLPDGEADGLLDGEADGLAGGLYGGGGGGGLPPPPPPGLREVPADPDGLSLGSHGADGLNSTVSG